MLEEELLVRGVQLPGERSSSNSLASRHKDWCWPRRYSPFGVHQAPSNEFSFISRQRPEKKSSWVQGVIVCKHNCSARMPGGQLEGLWSVTAFIQKGGQRIGWCTMCMSGKNSMLSKQEASLLNMNNNEIYHYTSEKSIEMQSISFCH